jgi:signal transduction histidine kinase
MTEMRALIFELRPESLEKEGLVAALEKAAAGVQARHDIRVETALGEEPDAPLEKPRSPSTALPRKRCTTPSSTPAQPT